MTWVVEDLLFTPMIEMMALVAPGLITLYAPSLVF